MGCCDSPFSFPTFSAAARMNCINAKDGRRFSNSLTCKQTTILDSKPHEKTLYIVEARGRLDNKNIQQRGKVAILLSVIFQPASIKSINQATSKKE